LKDADPNLVNSIKDVCQLWLMQWAIENFLLMLLWLNHNLLLC
jgi:hypothetical protein